MLALVRNSRGTSVMELLIAFSLFIIVVGTTYEFLTAGQKAASKTRDSFLAQTQIRAGIDNISDEIRWADAVAAASGTSVTVHIPQNTPFSISSPYYVTFTYDAVGKMVTRQQGPSLPIVGPITPIASNIVRPDGSGGLSFTYYNGAGISLGQTPSSSDLPIVARVRLTVIATTNSTSRILTGDAALRSR